MSSRLCVSVCSIGLLGKAKSQVFTSTGIDARSVPSACTRIEPEDSPGSMLNEVRASTNSTLLRSAGAVNASFESKGSGIVPVSNPASPYHLLIPLTGTSATRR